MKRNHINRSRLCTLPKRCVKIDFYLYFCLFVANRISPTRRLLKRSKMSIQTRGLVFATFFGNCLVVGLLVASLTTNYWVQSSAAKRHSNVTSREATGHLNFGLFSGYKELDVGFGNRPDTIDGMFYHPLKYN